MITYYPDGTWSTEYGNSDAVKQMMQAIRRLNDEDIERLFGRFVEDYIRLAEEDGSCNYTDDCDHDCRDCEYSDYCDDCEHSDVCDRDCEDCEYADCCEEYEEDEPVASRAPAPIHEAAKVYMCRDCEFHVVGFPCSNTTKKKKGCVK